MSPHRLRHRPYNFTIRVYKPRSGSNIFSSNLSRINSWTDIIGQKSKIPALFGLQTNIAAHLLGLEVVEGGGDLIRVGRVERLHGRREDLRLHRRRLQHPVRGEGGREVGRLELGCGGWGSWGRRKGRSNTVLKKSFVNIDKHLQSHISHKHIQREKGVFCWPPRIENWSG